MLTIRFLEESAAATDVSWLVWALLAVFVLMVFLGWWASGRLPKEEETIALHAGEHGGHDESAVDQ